MFLCLNNNRMSTSQRRLSDSAALKGSAGSNVCDWRVFRQWFADFQKIVTSAKKRVYSILRGPPQLRVVFVELMINSVPDRSICLFCLVYEGLGHSDMYTVK